MVASAHMWVNSWAGVWVREKAHLRQCSTPPRESDPHCEDRPLDAAGKWIFSSGLFLQTTYYDASRTSIVDMRSGAPVLPLYKEGAELREHYRYRYKQQWYPSNKKLSS